MHIYIYIYIYIYANTGNGDTAIYKEQRCFVRLYIYAYIIHRLMAYTSIAMSCGLYIEVYIYL